jgi:beta-lactamase superfamily II metal-dependent hydrolase
MAPLRLHFLNVGHGDCTLVELPSGRLMMIDISNSKSLPETDIDALAAHEGLSTYDFRYRSLYQGMRSWESYYESLLVDPVDYYNDHFDGQSIFRYIQSHPDMDHMTGLHRFFWQEKIPLGCFWDMNHHKKIEDFTSPRFSEVDWRAYEVMRGGEGPDGSDLVVIRNLRRYTGQYWTDDNIEVLSPTTELITICDKNDNYNDCSYVFKVNYGGRSVILPGDAEAAAWSSMLDDLGPYALKCDVLKAAHHGRESGYHEEAVNAMSPDVVICSVGKKPETDASDEYASHGAEVFSTRYHGTITVTIWDDGDIWVKDHSGNMIHRIT